MSTTPIAPLEETRRTLEDSARKRFGSIPLHLIVGRALAASEGADLPVRQAALEALARRMQSARRDELVVASRPARTALGAYTTKRRGESAAARPYETCLFAVDPPRGSCDCPDFARSSLGLCKHLLVVLEDAIVRGAPARTVDLPPLQLDPAIPLDAPPDHVLALRWRGTPVTGGALGEALRFFRDGRPVPTRLADPRARRQVVALLHRLAKADRKLACPAARAALSAENARLERLAAFEVGADAARAALKSLKRRLYPYQRASVERFLAQGRLLLADDMGLGKTTQAIAACHALHKTGAVRRGLLVVPASLKSQWLREWNDTTDARASIVEGSPAERLRQYRATKSGFLILGYEQLLRDFEAVRRFGADIVVLDEAQRIKNYATKSAAYVKALEPAFRLVLTGTPMENRLEELASILDWIDDLALAPKWRLVPWHTSHEGDGARGAAGARNLKALRARLEGAVVRRVRADVIAQLPPRTDTRVPVPMTEQQRVEHDALDMPIAAIVQRAKKRPLTQPEFIKLMQLLTMQRIYCNGVGLARFEESWPSYGDARPDRSRLDALFAPKLDELRRLVQDLVVVQGRKVVVFSQWRRMLRLAAWSVRDILDGAGLRAVFFTGAESLAQRTKSVVDLHDDERARVMFISDAGGTGLNLQRAATACINLELPWNPAVLEQRIGRIYRLGQTRPIDVFNLVSEEGIEARIADVVRTKSALFRGVFDGSSDEVRFDAAPSFVARVEQLVAPALAKSPPPPQVEPAEDEEEPREEEKQAAPEEPAAQDDAAALGRWVASIKIERTPSGGIRLEAPKEAAEPLAALFGQLAAMMRAPGPGASS